MNKSLQLLILLILSTSALKAQITITAADMPVNGDTLRYSAAAAVGVSTSTTGANISWDYSSLVPQFQAIDTYKTAAAAGYTGGGIPATAFGYKIADSLSFPGAPVSATNIYTFFNTKTSPSRYVAEGFGAKLSVIPVSGGYSNEDTLYNFPLSYNRMDSGTFKLNISIIALGSLKQQGKRVTLVDGWGTIKTPFYTTPVAALRIRSEVNEIDTVVFSSQTIGVPRHYVDYIWLTNGQHYPVLHINSTVTGTTETPTTVQYRDSNRNLVGVKNVSGNALKALEVFPNPSFGNEIQLKVPASWSHYTVYLYDMNGKIIRQSNSTAHIATSDLASGKYIIVVDAGSDLGIAQFVR